MKFMDKKKIVLNNGTILKLKRFYKYSGKTENLYNTVFWKDVCKVVKITDDMVHIYEPFNNKLYYYGLETINKMTFKPWWKW